MSKDAPKPGRRPARSAGKVSVGTSVSRTPSYTSIRAYVDEGERLAALIIADGPVIGRVEEVLGQVDHPGLVHERTTFADALEWLRRDRHDLALVVCTDDGRGQGLIRAWRAEGGCTPILTVADVAGVGSREQRAILQKEGATESVQLADLSPPLLQLAIESALRHSQLSRQLTELRERFGLAIRGARDGMWEWNLENDALFFSQRWKELLGFEGDEIGTDTEEWFGRVHPQDLARLRADLEALIRGEKTHHSLEHRVRAKDGSFRWVLSRGVVQRTLDGHAVRLAGSMTDISEYRAREQSMRDENKEDSVTLLPRRSAFMERLGRAVDMAREHADYGFAVLLVDVDRYGHLHDSMGARPAEQLLAQVARRLEEAVGPENFVARFGNETFAILLENIVDPSSATHVADAINIGLSEPIDLDQEDIYVTVSIGVTSSARGYLSAEDVITDVNTAAAKARKGGKSREVFNTQMRIEAMTMLRLEMQLRQAVERDEFQLYYQPIMALENQSLAGFEALVRWKHPRRGVVSPNEFIPIAETTGLIIPIGRWALHEAARQLAEWRREFDLDARTLSVSVNLSGRQTTDPRLLREIQSAIDINELSRGSLKIELTESVLMENADMVTDLLNQLRAMGVHIYVDDFGTGYSSLSYLHQFPVDGLKIDKSFVDVLDGTAQSTAMVRTILDLASNLNVEVIAEGIEEGAQALQLFEMGCQLGQGYLFNRPLSPGDAYAEVARFFG